MNLCFDFDGPIIDVSDRYYRAYLESLKDVPINKEQILTKADFWKLKQNRITDLEIGVLSGLGISESIISTEVRKELVFKQESVYLDKLFDDVFKVFDYLRSKNKSILLVTLRREKELLFIMEELKLRKYFTNEKLFALTDEQMPLNDIQAKHLLLVKAINRLSLNPEETCIIGDSDTDIHAGRLAKYGRIIAISRGIRSKLQLSILKPDYIIDNLTEFLNLL